MGDEQIRELERRWGESEDPEVAAALIAARLRTGALDPQRVLWAAAIGYGPARQARGDDPSQASPENALLACVSDDRAGLGEHDRRWLCVAFVERVMPLWTGLHPDEKEVPAALELARQAALGHATPQALQETAGGFGPMWRRGEIGNTLMFHPRAVQAACLGNAAATAVAAAEAAAQFTGEYSFFDGPSPDPLARERAWQAELVGKVLCQLTPLPASVDSLVLEAPEIDRQLWTLATGGFGELVYVASAAGHPLAHSFIDRYAHRWGPSSEEPLGLEPEAPQPSRTALDQLLQLSPHPGGWAAVERMLWAWRLDCVERTFPVLEQRGLLAPALVEALAELRRGREGREAGMALIHGVRLGDTRDCYGADPWRTAYEALAEVGDGEFYALRRAARVWSEWIRVQRAGVPSAEPEALEEVAEDLEEVDVFRAIRVKPPDPLVYDPRLWAVSCVGAEARFELQRERRWQASRLCAYLNAYPQAPAPPTQRALARECAAGPLLRVVVGPQEGERWFLPNVPFSVTLIGRSETAHVRLTDPRVSRSHAALLWEDGRWKLLNRSSQGTKVDDVPIETVELKPGACIALGKTRLVLEVYTPPDLSRFDVS